MIRSMCTAISSLNLNQTYLDVISDNLANSNTTGFKSSRVIFQDQFAQIMSSGAAPIGEVGGINPTEIGLGVKLGYVAPTFTQGMMQSTGKSTDLAIQGNGFFVYTNGQTTSYSREGSLEIDADGYLVNNSTGMRIMGWTITPGSSTTIDTNQPISSMQISLDATIARATTTASLTGNVDSGSAIPVDAAVAAVNDASIGTDYTVALATPTNPSLELASGTYTMRTIISGDSVAGYTYSAQLLNSLGNSVGTAITGTYDNTSGATIPLGNGLTFTIASGLAGADEVPAQLDTASIGTGMTASVSTVPDGGTELPTGTYSVDYTITGDVVAGYNYSMQLLDSVGGAVGAALSGAYNPATGTSVNFSNGLTVALASGLGASSATGTQFDYTESIPAEGAQTITSGNVVYSHSVSAVTAASVATTIAVYDSLGASHTPTVTFTRTDNPLLWTWAVTQPTDAQGNGTIVFNSDGTFNSATGTDTVIIPGSEGADYISMDLDLSSITMLSADTTLAASNQDGLAAGSVSELYGAPNTGEMYLVYSNGLKQLCGQLALAFFTNPSGLLRSGGNQYKIGLNSGEPQIGVANTGGRGAISSGYLEASNVDIAQEFTNMILAQRSFQASARVITTSDQILQELVNLKQ